MKVDWYVACPVIGRKISAERLLIPIKVDLAKLPAISNWKRNYTLENVLIELRRLVDIL
jgi:hypothetical protein